MGQQHQPWKSETMVHLYGSMHFSLSQRSPVFWVQIVADQCAGEALKKSLMNSMIAWISWIQAIQALFFPLVPILRSLVPSAKGPPWPHGAPLPGHYPKLEMWLGSASYALGEREFMFRKRLSPGTEGTSYWKAEGWGRIRNSSPCWLWGRKCWKRKTTLTQNIS